MSFDFPTFKCWGIKQEEGGVLAVLGRDGDGGGGGGGKRDWRRNKRGLTAKQERLKWAHIVNWGSFSNDTGLETALRTRKAE